MTADMAAIGLVVVPLAAAVAVFTVAGRRAALWSLLAAVGQLGLMVRLTQAILRDGPLSYRLGGWEAPLGIELYADGISVLMLGMTAVVGTATTIYASGYFALPGGDPVAARGEEAARTFWPLWMVLWAALNAVFLSADIFNLYVTLELITLSAVALIGVAGKVSALVAALRYLIAALVGSLFYLLGVALIYGIYGTVSWQLLGAVVRADAATSAAAVLMAVGLMLKTALFPLHFWLPAAHANAPAPVSGLLSGLVLKASFFIMLRLWFFPFQPLATPLFGYLLSGLGAAAILWGSVQALRQGRVKLMIAYSTVAQIGYLFLVFTLGSGEAGMLAWRGTAYFALSHALAKAAVFMVAGSLMHAVGSDRLEDWTGIAHREPMMIFTFGLAGLTLMGLPPSGGFIAKWLLLNAAIRSGHWGLTVVMLTGGLLAAAYVFRVLAPTLAAPRAAATRPLPRGMRWTPLALAAAATVFGVITTEPLQLLEIGSPFSEPGGGP